MIVDFYSNTNNELYRWIERGGLKRKKNEFFIIFFLNVPISKSITIRFYTERQII